MKLKLIFIGVMVTILSSCDIGERIWLMHEICNLPRGSSDQGSGSNQNNYSEPGLFGTLNSGTRSSDGDNCATDPRDAMCILPGDNDQEISDRSGLPICTQEQIDNGRSCNDDPNCPYRDCRYNSHNSTLYCKGQDPVHVPMNDHQLVPGLR